MEDVYRLEDAAAELWLEGYPFTEYVRARLVERLDKAIVEQEAQLQTWKRCLETGERLPEDHPVWRAQFGRPDISGVYRVLSPGERSTLVYIFLESMTREVPDDVVELDSPRWDEDAFDVLDKPFSALAREYPEPFRELLEGDVDPAEIGRYLKEFTESFNPPRLRNELRSLSPSQFDEIRDQVVEALERWGHLVDRPRADVAASIARGLLMYWCCGIEILTALDRMLSDEDESIRNVGRLWRDHLLGIGLD
jgi:hypothetical protein